MSTYKDDNNNDVSKLVIMVIGISTIALFAYLIFRERNRPQQTISLDQHLQNLEEKINRIQPIQHKVVSMSKPKNIQDIKRHFGMA